MEVKFTQYSVYVFEAQNSRILIGCITCIMGQILFKKSHEEGNLKPGTLFTYSCYCFDFLIHKMEEGKPEWK